MDRLERLVNLVAALLEADQPLTRHELRTRVGGYADDDDAFRRNFERDKDLLRQMGMPLVMEPVDPLAARGSGRLSHSPRALRAARPGSGARRAGRPAPGRLGGGGRRGVGAQRVDDGAVEAGGLQRRSRAPARPIARAEAAPKRWPSCPAGTGWRCCSRPSPPASGSASPTAARNATWIPGACRIATASGTWPASTTAGASARTYRLDRLGATPQVVGEPGAFARPTGAAGAPPPPWQLGDDEEASAELLVDAIQAEWAAAAVGEAAVVERRPDGSVVLRVAVTNRDAFRSFVLGFLDHAEVLGPPAIRQDLVAWLEGLAAAPVVG